jgi:RimJ/RimL family protein N-acetyltransferase
MAKYARFICRAWRGPTSSDDVCRWLDIPRDIPLLNELWQASGAAALPDAEWEQIARDGYRYAVIVQAGLIVSIAATWKRSTTEWELAAVSTREGHRRLGHAADVCAFVTAYVLAEGRHATCTTRADNEAMIATALSLGYERLPNTDDCPREGEH